MARQSSRSKGSRSSKTAHVLGLLTNASSTRAAEISEDNEKASQEAAPENPAKQAEKQALTPPEEMPARMLSPSVPAPSPSHRAVDQEVELQIRSALEDALLAETGTVKNKAPEPEPTAQAELEPGAQAEPEPELGAQAEPEPEPVVQAEPEPEPVVQAEPEPEPVAQAEPEPEPVVQAEPEPEPVVQAEPEPEPVVQAKPEPEPVAQAKPEPEPVAQAKPEPVPAPVENETPEIFCFNVMQAIVEEKVDKYIKMFGLCSCQRCRVDVTALTLTNLPAKYVVVTEQDQIPMLSVYEGRYNAAVIAQVMSACKTVMKYPRHGNLQKNN